MLRFLLFNILVFFSIGILYAQSFTFRGKVIDKKSGDPIEFATIAFEDNTRWCVTNEEGNFRIGRISKGKKKIFVNCLGYRQKKIELNFTSSISGYVINLIPDNILLKEVVVTATESNGLTSASYITKEAIELLQPTSFTDILELLPGGKSQDPQMGVANIIKLREVGSKGENFDISSLGVSFVIDNTPIQGDANLQTLPHVTSLDPHFKRNIVNKGVDMRTISTDNIESVEIIRGIPSVEYGDLTSGLVKINRKIKPSKWEMRIKADEYGKLFSLGKGFTLDSSKHNINFNIDYLNSKIDPRNHLKNYKRLTGSLRYQFKSGSNKSPHLFKWNAALDYAGSFDNEKIDPDISLVKVDYYESKYNKFTFRNSLLWFLRANRFLKSLSINTSFSVEKDVLTRRKFISIIRDTPIPNNLTEGVHDGAYLPYQYVADFQSEGIPLYAYIKVKSSHPKVKLGNWGKTSFILGSEWNLAKNIGRGQLYDLERPIATLWASRPRAYKDIPALQRFSFFVENRGVMTVGETEIQHSIGVRGVSLLGLSKQYSIHNKFFGEPRLNIKWQLWDIPIHEKKLQTSIGYGIGYSHKMPTIAHLYPNKYYNDIVQLNYFHENFDFRRLNILTHIIDKTNYKLQPAKNIKWEIRLDANYEKHRFSLTYFEEKMNSGFRQMAYYAPVAYRQYDIHSIDHSTVTQQPKLSDFTYENKVILDGYTKTSNGSALWKKGIEFQYESPRITGINTKLTANGAWFYNTYSNSLPMYRTVSTVIDGTSLQYKYVGLYDWNSGNIKQQMNTNIILDTQFPRLGLIFAVSVQSTWLNTSQIMYQNGTPMAYIAVDGKLHPYGDKEKKDKELQHLTLTFNQERYSKRTVPFGTLINLKATKQIGNVLKVAIFVNRILDYLPSYKSNNILVRRYTDSYFGMELNWKF